MLYQCFRIGSRNCTGDGTPLRRRKSPGFHYRSSLGLGIAGFDRINKVYTYTWADSMGTAINTLTGTSSADGTIITFTGTGPCPQEGKNIPMRVVITWNGPDNVTMELFATRGGTEAKGMELTYTRRR